MRLRRLLAKLTSQARLIRGKRHGLPGTTRLDIACRWEGVLSSKDGDVPEKSLAWMARLFSGTS